MMRKIKVLGVGVTLDNLQKILNELKKILRYPAKGYYIVTPNPEIILQAQTDKELLNILNKSNVALPDGFGLRLAMFLIGERQVRRITGSDFCCYLLDFLNKKKSDIAVVRWENSLSSEGDIERALKNKYTNLKINFLSIKKTGESGRKWAEKCYLESSDSFKKSQVMFVLLGAPFQEKFIYYTKNKSDDLKVSIGVGGAFDFLTGKIKRAPKFLRRLGLEWAWRFYKQPRKRASRIFKAVVIFPFRVLKNYFS